MNKTEFDVIIIGGGITGAGIARDCAMRGLKVLLVERNDIATGATGRNHGLLHSGARYAVADRESARECIRENHIIKKIASNCVEDTKGLFITLPQDTDRGYGLDYQKTFVKACQKAGISADVIDPKEAIRMEPSVNPKLIGAVVVPDCAVDPFQLCAANVLDARIHGATTLHYCTVTDFILENGAVTGIKVYDKATRSESEYRAAVTVNAAGIWGRDLALKAGINIEMYPAKGSLLIFGHRVNNVVVNHCRPSSNGDILVPDDIVCVLGTTSERIPFEECDNMYVPRKDVELLLNEGSEMVPVLANTRILRAYAGVRPLISAGEDEEGRGISRGYVCLDHEKRDGVKGLITVSGGKLTTYRLMSEVATDMICKKLGNKKSCETASTPLPGSEGHFIRKKALKLWPNPGTGQKAAAFRQGSLSSKIHYDTPEDKALVCECEHVTLGEIKYAVDYLGVRTLRDLRRRTRIGMGTCQGTHCTWKTAAALANALGTPERADELAADYLNERWKGMVPVGWGEALRRMELMQRVYKFGKPDTYK